MKDVKEILKEMVSEPIGVDSAECAIWKAEHSKCTDCEYELGCNKYVTLLMIQTHSSMYQPKDFEDSIASAKKAGELMAKVVEAKTNDEVRAII